MEGKSTKSSESQYTIMKLERNLHFLQASVLVRTVSESESDNDLVLCDESESESKSDDDSHTVTIQERTSTRTVRRVGHWSASMNRNSL